MSKLPPNQLTVRKVASLKDGVHGDGGNLWITVRGDTRAWTFRYKSPETGKRREMGLGPARDISLADARLKATKNRRLLLEGIDPLEEKARQAASTLSPMAWAKAISATSRGKSVSSAAQSRKLERKPWIVTSFVPAA